jgi:hypothetical protein
MRVQHADTCIACGQAEHDETQATFRTHDDWGKPEGEVPAGNISGRQ